MVAQLPRSPPPHPDLAAQALARWPHRADVDQTDVVDEWLWARLGIDGVQQQPACSGDTDPRTPTPPTNSTLPKTAQRSA